MLTAACIKPYVWIEICIAVVHLHDSCDLVTLPRKKKMALFSTKCIVSILLIIFAITWTEKLICQRLDYAKFILVGTQSNLGTDKKYEIF